MHVRTDMQLMQKACISDFHGRGDRRIGEEKDGKKGEGEAG